MDIFRESKKGKCLEHNWNASVQEKSLRVSDRNGFDLLICSAEDFKHILCSFKKFGIQCSLTHTLTHKNTKEHDLIL